MNEFFIDSKLQAYYARDVESKKIYAPIYIRNELSSIEEYLAHFEEIGIDVYSEENFVLLSEIGLLTHKPIAGEHHNSGDFRNFCYTWYGNKQASIHTKVSKRHKKRFNPKYIVTDQWIVGEI